MEDRLTQKFHTEDKAEMIDQIMLQYGQEILQLKYCNKDCCLVCDTNMQQSLYIGKWLIGEGGTDVQVVI